MKTVFLTLLVVVFSFCADAQEKYDLSICCIKYDKGLLHFSVVNNSDSITKLQFPGIAMQAGKDVILFYKLTSDTLELSFLGEERTNISASGKLEYQIDGDPYLQRAIPAHAQHNLAIKIGKQCFRRINSIKVTFPGGQNISAPIKS